MTGQCLHLQKICTNAKYNNIFFTKNDISNGQKEGWSQIKKFVAWK